MIDLVPTRFLAATALALLAFAALGTGCAAANAEKTGTVRLPPVGAAPDYQLGGAYAAEASVEVVARDRASLPADGVYSICYINGFQTQPHENHLWADALLLHDADGKVVFDPNWPDEALLDTSSAASRAAISEIVEEWITSCADVGFDAVEFDNLDTYTRSGGALTFEDNRQLAARFVKIAHDAGLAAGQKNAAEDAASLRHDVGFDFAIAEACAAFDECSLFTAVYGDHVIDIEYSDDMPRTFREVCADPATPESVVLRDRPLAPQSSPGYVFELCPAE